MALVEGEEATLKRLRRKGASIALEAANPAYETRIFGPDQVAGAGQAGRPDPPLSLSAQDPAGIGIADAAPRPVAAHVRGPDRAPARRPCATARPSRRARSRRRPAPAGPRRPTAAGASDRPDADDRRRRAQRRQLPRPSAAVLPHHSATGAGAGSAGAQANRVAGPALRPADRLSVRPRRRDHRSAANCRTPGRTSTACLARLKRRIGPAVADPEVRRRRPRPEQHRRRRSGRPSQRSRPCHRQRNSTPRKAIGRAQSGRAGDRLHRARQARRPVADRQHQVDRPCPPATGTARPARAAPAPRPAPGPASSGSPTSGDGRQVGDQAVDGRAVEMLHGERPGRQARDEAGRTGRRPASRRRRWTITDRPGRGDLARPAAARPRPGPPGRRWRRTTSGSPA